jgi:hypothetical protein
VSFFCVALSFGGMFLLTGCGGSSDTGGTSGQVEVDKKAEADRQKMIENAYSKKK